VNAPFDRVRSRIDTLDARRPRPILVVDGCIQAGSRVGKGGYRRRAWVKVEEPERVTARSTRSVEEPAPGQLHLEIVT
jgi:hypothetical protein